MQDLYSEIEASEYVGQPN